MQGNEMIAVGTGNAQSCGTLPNHVSVVIEIQVNAHQGILLGIQTKLVENCKCMQMESKKALLGNLCRALRELCHQGSSHCLCINFQIQQLTQGVDKAIVAETGCLANNRAVQDALSIDLSDVPTHAS